MPPDKQDKLAVKIAAEPDRKRWAVEISATGPLSIRALLVRAVLAFVGKGLGWW